MRVRVVVVVAILVGGLAACASPDEDVVADPLADTRADTRTEGNDTVTDVEEPGYLYDPPPRRDPGDDRTAEPGESVALIDGESLVVAGLRVTVVSAEGVPEDCDDCPLRVTLEVTDGQQSEELTFSFSGLMPEDTLEERRTADVFDRTIRIDSVAWGQVELTVS